MLCLSAEQVSTFGHKIPFLGVGFYRQRSRARRKVREDKSDLIEYSFLSCSVKLNGGVLTSPKQSLITIHRACLHPFEEEKLRVIFEKKPGLICEELHCRLPYVPFALDFSNQVHLGPTAWVTFLASISRVPKGCYRSSQR